MPDSTSADNALVGNMLLLEPRLNARCANKNLDEKLPIYMESNFATTRAFAKRYSKKDFDIRSRTEHMSDRLYESIAKASGTIEMGGAR